MKKLRRVLSLLLLAVAGLLLYKHGASGGKSFGTPADRHVSEDPGSYEFYFFYPEESEALPSTTQVWSVIQKETFV